MVSDAQSDTKPSTDKVAESLQVRRERYEQPQGGSQTQVLSEPPATGLTTFFWLSVQKQCSHLPQFCQIGIELLIKSTDLSVIAACTLCTRVHRYWLWMVSNNGELFKCCSVSKDKLHCQPIKETVSRTVNHFKK